MADFVSATTAPGGRSPQVRASGHAQRGYWLSVASISVGMVAYFGLAISLDHR